MSEYNRYQAPKSQVDGTTTEEFAEMKLFGVSGRIGRVRYLAYSVGVNFLIMVVIALLSGTMKTVMGSGGAIISVVLMFAAYVFMFVYSIMLAIRRAHDFNVTGWLSVLIFVPLVNLLFMFVPGTQGNNDFGAPPPPNTTGNIILATVMPIIAIAGILAAIAIPAYNSYIQKAQQAQQHQSQRR